MLPVWRSVAVFGLAWQLACGGAAPPAPEKEAASPADALAQALTFHASFDDGMDAAFALGDRRIYSAPSYKEQDQRAPGPQGDGVEIAYDAGRWGHALLFKRKNTTALFYSAAENVAFSEDGWSGTISYWLSLDPETDLEPGFCDPIQVTDSAYNDNAIWTDFTKETPRGFRLGVFGELDAWKPKNPPPDQDTVFENRLVTVESPPFAKGAWTHVAVTHEALGTASGRASLYLNAELQGSAEGISEPFVWDLSKAAIRVGVNYVGLYDELTVFNRPLSGEEIRALYELDGGAAALRR